MLRKQVSYFLFLLIFIAACDKPVITSNTQNNTIDVSAQWHIDGSGYLFSSPGDSQWQNISFTPQEQNLFSSLDTANLAGTSTPDSVKSGPPIYNAIVPNPFTDAHQIGFALTNGYSGEFVLKYVIVDSLMNALDKKVVRMHYPYVIGVMPSIPVGRFRLYYSLSSESDPGFFKTWGNIQKIP